MPWATTPHGVVAGGGTSPGWTCDRRGTRVPPRLANLAEQLEGDEQTVDDQRLDERQTDDLRDEDLARGLRVARDALEGRAGRAALAERAAQSGQTDGERRRQSAPLVAIGANRIGRVRERGRGSQQDDSGHASGDDGQEQL